jgi:DNA-binding NarL/FixJ family response regulator
MRALRILIADDHAAVRRGIRSLLDSEPQWRVCGEARDGVEAVDLASRLRPDVVVLDVTMPRLDGLAAAREIGQHVPDAKIVVLTTHGLDVANEELRRAGSHAVVAKAEADRSLIAAIEKLRPRRADIHLAGSVVGRRRHIAAFFHSEEERYRVLASFIAEGLAGDEKALHIIDPPSRAVHLQQLRDRGIDGEGAEARGQLELVPWQETYLRGGRFDENAMLALMRTFVESGSPSAYPLTRLVAQMEWALENFDGMRDLIRYEARLNDVLDDYDDVVICAYDVARFPADVITDVARAHPAAVIDGSLRRNVDYTAPAELLEELASRSAGGLHPGR